jgi:hypothetical protein
MYQATDFELTVRNFNLVPDTSSAADSNIIIKQQRDQLKQRLSVMRQRTKILLEKHNWKKFFASPSNQTESSETQRQLFEQVKFNSVVFNSQNTILTHDFDEDNECSSSNYSTPNSSLSSPPFSKHNQNTLTRQNSSKLNLFSLDSVSTIPILEYDSIFLDNTTNTTTSNNQHKNRVEIMPIVSTLAKGMQCYFYYNSNR